MSVNCWTETVTNVSSFFPDMRSEFGIYSARARSMRLYWFSNEFKTSYDYHCRPLIIPADTLIFYNSFMNRTTRVWTGRLQQCFNNLCIVCWLKFIFYRLWRAKFGINCVFRKINEPCLATIKRMVLKWSLYCWKNIIQITETIVSVIQMQRVAVNKQKMHS